MKNAAPWKIWLVFAGVFLAGGIAGGFISLRVVDRIVERGRAQAQFAPRLLNHLTERLDLTAEQQAQVRVMVDAAWQDMQAQRRAGRETMTALNEQVNGILTPQQRAEFKSLRESQRERWQNLSGERRGPGHRAGGPPPEGREPRPGAPPPPEQ